MGLDGYGVGARKWLPGEALRRLPRASALRSFPKAQVTKRQDSKFSGFKPGGQLPKGGRDKYSVTVRGHLFLAPFAPGWSYFDPFFIPQLEEISAWREMNLEGPGRGEGGFGAYLDFRRTTNPEGFWVFWGFLLGGWGDLTRGWGGFGVRTRRLSAR